MIELQRAKLLGSKKEEATVKVTPQQAAANAIREEELQLQKFIHRLQRRDDSHPLAASTESSAAGGPTVPTALSRRMLQRQGVGYLDDTVAAIASASADRFLATVLQQAIACRDRRLEGAEMAREAAKQRKRHLQQVQADADDRKRRRTESDAKQEKSLLTTIGTAEALKKGGGAAASAAAAMAKKEAEKKKASKKKKVSISEAENSTKNTANGKKPDAAAKGNDGGSDLDTEYDSIDEEEDYYQEHYGDTVAPIKGGDDDDDDVVLILRDLVRPLEAWRFNVTGKLGLEIRDSEADENLDGTGAEDDEEDGADAGAAVAASEENGVEDGLFNAAGTSEGGSGGATANSGKAESKQPSDETESAASAATKRKAAPSPVPQS